MIEQFIDNIEEIWRDIKGYEGLYQVSNYGKVKRIKTRYNNKCNKILKPSEDGSGYLSVVLCKDGKMKSFGIHKLVLGAFIGLCPKNMERCHNDGNIYNNYIGNLRYDTHYNNMQDSIKHKTIKNGSKHYCSVVNELQVRIIKRLLEDAYLTQKEIAKIFNVSKHIICGIANNRTWKHIK